MALSNVYVDESGRRVYNDPNKGVVDVKTGELVKSLTTLPTPAPTREAMNLGTITAESMATTPPITPQIPQQIPIYPVAGLNQGNIQPIPNSELTLTAPEREAQDINERLRKLYEERVGEAGFRAEKEIEARIPELSRTQTELSSRLGALQREALAIPLQLQQEAAGRGITAGGLRPLEIGALRTNAIQALGISSLLEASRGNLQLAYDQVDRAVAQKFDPIKEEIAVKMANLDLILKSPAYTLAERNRAQIQKDSQEARAREIARQESIEKEIKGYAVEAAKRGATSGILQKIQSARSSQEALQLAGFYLGEDFRREVEKEQFQRSLQEKTFNLSMAKFDEDRRQFNLEYALRNQKIATEQFEEAQKKNPVITAEATTEVLQDKIDLIDNLINHKGLDSRVGPTFLTRGITSLQDRFGSGQDFAAGVAQLVNKETIDTLVNLKARGGTLGALSDQERILLQSAATKIGSWEIKKDGIGIGKYNTSEENFKAELNRIKDLTIKAKARALGGGGMEVRITTEEDELRAAGYSDEQIRLLKEL